MHIRKDHLKFIACVLLFATLIAPAEAAGSGPTGNVPSPAVCRLLIVFACAPTGLHQLTARALKALLAQLVKLTETVSYFSSTIYCIYLLLLAR